MSVSYCYKSNTWTQTAIAAKGNEEVIVKWMCVNSWILQRDGSKEVQSQGLLNIAVYKISVLYLAEILKIIFLWTKIKPGS